MDSVSGTTTAVFVALLGGAASLPCAASGHGSSSADPTPAGLAPRVPELESAAPRYPFPQHVTYAPGSLQPSHRTQAQLDDDVSIAYWRWKGSYVTQAGTEADGHARYRVKLGAAETEPTVSEGHGYGMLITALMAGLDADARTVFDGLWEFFNDHRSENETRLMDWHVPADETPEPGFDTSAFDGDCDIAFALLLAEQQWGNDGRVDYRMEARAVMAGLLDSTVGPVSRLPLLGDWVTPGGSRYNQYTPRTSDFMPDHFRAFGRATGDAVWDAVVRATQQTIDSLQANFGPGTGLVPDFAVPTSGSDPSPRPAPAEFLEGQYDGDYYYNAGRVPWRLGVDALLNDDGVSRAQVRKIALWVKAATGGVPRDIKPGYLLDGTPIPPAEYFSTFFAAPFGVAAMLDPAGQQWLNDTYDAVRSEAQGYFEDSVTLLSLLVMTRNYWDPALVGAIR
jgi:endo-1,4-beta-D-glucanase Y